MRLIAERSLSIQGTAYAKGDVVPSDVFAPGKAEQLLAQRMLRDMDAPAVTYRACRSFTVAGRTSRRGDRVEASALPAHKLAQLLEQRYLEPVPMLNA